MNIVGVTPTIQINLLDTGSLGWGTTTNQNFNIIDGAFLADRTRISALETTSAVLPLAIANRVGHNLLRNNIFQLPESSDPAKAIQWSPNFLNGAVGYTTRDSTTHYAGLSGPTSRTATGRFSQRISIVNINQANRVPPPYQMQAYELDSSGVATTSLPPSDTRQLLNSFGYVYQSINLSPNTRYTLSGYGKSEIPNEVLNIKVSWKLGVVFKDSGGTIIRSHFTTPQQNYTSSTGTAGFNRASLTFVTPDLPVVAAEVWLVNESVTPTSIGSSYFDGVQLEQSSSATFLETFSVRNGSLFVDGDLNVGGNLNLQQNQLVLATNKVILASDVQIGSLQGSSLVNVLDVYTKIATFYGPVNVKGNVTLGDNPQSDEVKVKANTTRFYSEPERNSAESGVVGGNVIVDGYLAAKGDVTLGTDATRDTVTFNAKLVTSEQDFTIKGDLAVEGTQTTQKSTFIGTDAEGNQTSRTDDRFVVNMDGYQGALGSDFYGNVRLHNKLTVTEDAYIGSSSQHHFVATVGSATITGDTYIQKGLTVKGPTVFNIGHDVADTFNVIARRVTFDTLDKTIWNASSFDLSGSLEVGASDQTQSFKALVGQTILGNSNSSLRSTASIYSTTTTIEATQGIALKGSVVIGEAANHNLTVTGGTIQFGTGLTPLRPFVQFITDNPITNKNNNPAHSGTIILGDYQGVQNISGVDRYQGTASIYAGTTYIGHPGTAGGLEGRGDLKVGGSIEVGGSATIGNSTLSDSIVVKANTIDLQVGAGAFNVGGTYNAGASYDATVDQGGFTVNSFGNIYSNGSLQIKGPISNTSSLTVKALSTITNPLEIYNLPENGTKIFGVSREGILDGYGGLQLGPNTKRFASLSSSTITLGNSSTPATTAAIYASNTTLSSNLTVGNTLTTNSLAVQTSSTMQGNLAIHGNATVDGGITSSGTQHSFGSSLSTGTFNVIAATTTIGVDGNATGGDLIVANDLNVRHTTTLGSQMFSQPASVRARAEFANKDITSVHSHAVVLDVGYDGYQQNEIFRQTAGVRIGGLLSGGTGGFQNRIYNPQELYHGGVTIDAYGNIYADGSIMVNGSVSYTSLTLTAPNGTPDGSALLTLNNNNTNLQALNIDNLGNITGHGYLSIDGYIATTSSLRANGGSLTTTATTFNLLNTNATTINLGSLVTTTAISGTFKANLPLEKKTYGKPQQLITKTKTGLLRRGAAATTQVSTWTSKTLPLEASGQSNFFNSICWSPELSLFVAVGYPPALSGNTQVILTSSDGVTWASAPSPIQNQWRSICWSSELGLFVAVGYGINGLLNGVMTSPDGLTWTIRTTPTSSQWYSICWSPELGLFVVTSVDGNGTIITSPDGINWTARDTATTNKWYSVCWSAELGLFVAVATTGTNRVMTSPDGINWTLRTTPSNLNAWSSICWSPELSLFVVVSQGRYDTGSLPPITQSVMTSPDGINWTARTAFDSYWGSVCWSSELGLFVALAWQGTNRIMTSPDGINWSSRSTTVTNLWMSICWSAELGIFAGISQDGRVITSLASGQLTAGNQRFTGTKQFNTLLEKKTYGKPQQLITKAKTGLLRRGTAATTQVSTWTARTGAAANSWLSTCWSPELGLFVAVASSGTNRIMTSPNGISWTATSAPESNSWTSVCWSSDQGLFVAVATSGTNRIMTSTDGTNWSAVSAPEANQWTSVCWSPELSLFIAVANSGTNRIMTSPNGFTWTAALAPETNSWSSICWSVELNLLVAIATSGTNRIMTSPDGINWTARSAPEANQWTSVCWSPELSLFVAVANSGTNRVMTSPDGIFWATRSAAEANSWTSIAWSVELGLLVAVSSDGTNRVMSSPDGINWTARASAAANPWTSICWSSELGLFAAVASSASNCVMTSFIMNRYLETTGVVSIGASSTTTNNFYLTTEGANGKLDIRNGNYNGYNTNTLIGQLDSTGNFKVIGNVTAAATLTPSDARLKSNITTIENALDTVLSLRGVSFTRDGKSSVGVIAQEVEKVLPQVIDHSDEYLAVAYGNIVGVLIEAMKEQQVQIEDLKRTIFSLSKK